MKKNKNDLISIIVTIYNSNLIYLEECLRSILLQSYKNLEVIIVDDFSKREIFKSQKKHINKKFKNKKIKFLRNKKNYGVGHSLNRGIKFSKGKYINWCSYDDYFHVDKIKTQYQEIKNLDNTVVSCNTFVKYEGLKFFRKQNYDFLEKNKDALIYKDKFSGGSFLIPRSLFQKCGYFNETLRFVQDYDLWLRWYDYNVKFRNVKNYLFYSRVHVEQDTNKKSERAMKEKKIFYMNYFKEKIDYFLNFYSFSEIFLITNSFLYRGYKVVANFVRNELLRYTFFENRYLFGFVIKLFFILSFKFVKILRLIVNVIKFFGLNLIKMFVLLKSGIKKNT